MKAKAWIDERAVELRDYEVEVKIAPATCWTPGWGRLGSRRPTTSLDKPFVEFLFSGKGFNKSDLLPGEPSNIRVGFALPKADALKLAHAVILTCSGEDVNSLSKIELKGLERKRSLLSWKMGFRASPESSI